MRALITLGAVAALAAGAAAQEAVVISGGTVYTGVAGAKPIEKGVVVIVDGKIAAAGPAASVAVPDGARTIDATGHWVVPGFIDGSSQLGLVEIGMVQGSRDTGEKGKPIQPGLRTLDAYNAESKVIAVQRVNGITTALVAPQAGNLIAGQSCLVHLNGRRPADWLVRSPIGLHGSIAESARRDDNAGPKTRMGLAAKLRQALVDAQTYLAKQARHELKLKAHQKKLADGEATEADAPEPPARDLGKEALGMVLRREIPLILQAKRSSDILLAIALSKEFQFRLILDGVTEGWKVADAIAAAKVPCIIGPITEQPARPESLGATMENAAKLHAAGVLFCISARDTHNLRNLPYEAGFAVSYGLPWDAALAAITANPAKIFGAEDRVGRIAKDLDADVVVWTGDPFQPRSTVKHLFIRGRELPLTNKQTDLRDQHGK
jgi:imidazolonepropionase-like amidohydrolase